MSHILTHNADYIQTVRKKDISKSWELKAINEKAAARYNEILIYARDSAYRLEIQTIDKEAITIDEGLGGFITNTQKAATENLRNCHFLAIKNEPHDPTQTAISYVIHNDICSSASSDQAFAFMPKGKNRVILAGANSILSPTSITNVLDAVYAMASSEEDVIIEQSHLLCRNNITATACIYDPEKFTLYLGKGGLTHPDQIISSGFHLSEYKSNSYHTIAFDGRYHQPAHSDFIPANQNPRGEYDVTRHQPEQRFALGLTTAAAATIMLSDNNSRLYDYITNPHIALHTGHWYNEMDALKKAITHGRQQLANYLFNDGELLENLQQLYHLDDPMLAQTMILKNIHNFPVYVGAAAEKSNQHLGHYIKEILLDDRDFSLLDNEFLTQLQYYIVQSPDLPPPPKPQHPQINLQEKLAKQAVPLMVHYSNFEAVLWHYEDYQSLLPTYLGELEDYYRQSRNQLIEKIIEHGDAHHILDKAPSEPLSSIERTAIKNLCNEIPVFIGPNADLANQQLLEVITEYMQHPHYKELLTEFDKEKASLLHEIKQDIIAKLPQPKLSQATQPTRNKKKRLPVTKAQGFLMAHNIHEAPIWQYYRWHDLITDIDQIDNHSLAAQGSFREKELTVKVIYFQKRPNSTQTQYDVGLLFSWGSDAAELTFGLCPHKNINIKSLFSGTNGVFKGTGMGSVAFQCFLKPLATALGCKISVCIAHIFNDNAHAFYLKEGMIKNKDNNYVWENKPLNYYEQGQIKQNIAHQAEQREKSLHSSLQ
ncbi:MAG: hypothetical protein ACOYK8_05345 [Alphaproteobacteria bacterium]